MSHVTNQPPRATPPEDEQAATSPARRRALTGRSKPLIERGLVIFLAVVLGLLAACVPFARMLDLRIDRQRPMYTQMRTMAWLQYLNLEAGGEVVPGTVHGGESLAVGGQTFTVASGVTMEVRREGDGFCVRVANHHGDQSRWQCHDLDDPPEKP